jgi:PhzF family phenazine biosynthesis protein
VHGADGLSTDQCRALAQEFGFSETTFPGSRVLAGAEYSTRIFTPGSEIPFAGHPTLGSAHAWLAAGGRPKDDDVVQECGLGLVTLRRSGSTLSFRAPALRRSGPLDEEHVRRITSALRIDRARIVAHQWVDNGPGWAAVRLATAGEVLALEPDDVLLRELMVGVVGPYPADSPRQFEVRAFAGPVGVPEDPVTGSLNAGIGQWLIADGTAPRAYLAGQGARVGRRGVVTVESDDAGDVWVGGSATTCITGTVEI